MLGAVAVFRVKCEKRCILEEGIGKDETVDLIRIPRPCWADRRGEMTATSSRDACSDAEAKKAESLVVRWEGLGLLRGSFRLRDIQFAGWFF